MSFSTGQKVSQKLYQKYEKPRFRKHYKFEEIVQKDVLADVCIINGARISLNTSNLVQAKNLGLK